MLDYDWWEFASVACSSNGGPWIGYENMELLIAGSVTAFLDIIYRGSCSETVFLEENALMPLPDVNTTWQYTDSCSNQVQSCPKPYCQFRTN